MMNKSIDEILAEYESAAARPEGARLAEWVQRYPEHKRELVDYALYSTVMEHGVPYAAGPLSDGAVRERRSAYDPRTEQQEAARFLARADAVRRRMQAAESAAQPMASLVAAAREHGLGAPALSERLQVGLSLLMKLDQRLIAAATLPRELVVRLADALGRPVADVAAYLRQTPRLAQGAMYKARQAPRAAHAEDFAAALEGARDMTAEQKDAWRSGAGDTLGEER